MKSFRIEDLKYVGKNWKPEPITLYATKCTVCEKVLTSTDPDGSNRRGKYLVHLNWSHNHIRRRERGDVADEMKRREVSVVVP